MTSPRRFDFGKNWQSFSQSALTAERVSQARTDFRDLMQGIPLRGRSFIDIGFGQGLAVALAYEAGARVYATDINPKCVAALNFTSRFFPNLDVNSVPVVIGSILDNVLVEQLRQLSPDGDGFDIVHSWGVLHHTGSMEHAIRQAASLVRPQGYFVIAIYNAHWSSPIWHFIKRIFVMAPSFIQRILTVLFYPVIFVAKAIVLRQNPLKKERGMDFYHDVIDWIGGYPYEYSSPAKVRFAVEALGFRSERTIPAAISTGCNQFVFRRQ